MAVEGAEKFQVGKGFGHVADAIEMQGADIDRVLRAHRSLHGHREGDVVDILVFHRTMQALPEE